MAVQNRITASVALIQTWTPIICPDPRKDIDELHRQDIAFRESNHAVAEFLQSIDGGDIYRKIADIRSRYGRQYPVTATSRIAPSSPTEDDVRRYACNYVRRYTRNHLKSGSGWKWYDARYMIATALGAPRPEWDGSTFSWWMDRERGNPLVPTMSPSEIASVPIPDWSQLPQVAEMLESRRRWTEAFPGDSPSFPNIELLDIHAGESKRYVAFPSFVDLGIFLLGTTDFLTELGLESELADALMRKSFELSTSFVDFLRTLDPRPMELLLGFAGDTACLLSSDLYEKYSVRWDAGLFEYAKMKYGCRDDYPCNLHSCGPSDHLYEAWGAHPHNDQIVVLQTRFLPGTVGSLRRNMNNAVLQLTFHPQHYDVTKQSPEDFRRILIETSDDAEGRDVHFSLFTVVNQPEEVAGLRRNLDVLEEVLRYLND